MSATPQPLTPASIASAYDLISPHIHSTPLLTSRTLSTLATTHLSHPTTLYFKAENTQLGGAFKIRGATHALLRLTPAERARGVITHSSGNHGACLALAARNEGVACTVVMPHISTPGKIAATKGYGAHVVFSGALAPEREAKVKEEMNKGGQTLVPPYDHPDVIVGQGTMGLEMLRQIKEMGNGEEALDVVITPCGGGGMLAGVCVAMHGSGARVYGAEPEEGGADDAKRGLALGRRIEQIDKATTIADGLRTPVGRWNWGIISNKDYLKGIFSVTETQIKDAMRLVFERMKYVIEPSSAVPVAVVLFNEAFKKEIAEVVKDREKDRPLNIGIVLSGGNITVDRIVELFSK